MLLEETKIHLKFNNICRLILSYKPGILFWCHIFCMQFSTNVHHETGPSKIHASEILAFLLWFEDVGRIFETMPVVFNYSLCYWTSISILWNSGVILRSDCGDVSRSSLFFEAYAFLHRPFPEGQGDTGRPAEMGIVSKPYSEWWGALAGD